MMPLAILGVLTIALIIGYGVYMLTQNVTLKDKRPRYTYEETTDEDGNIIEVVKDRQDKE
jgi:hypothetical protein